MNSYWLTIFVCLSGLTNVSCDSHTVTVSNSQHHKEYEGLYCRMYGTPNITRPMYNGLGATPTYLYWVPQTENEDFYGWILDWRCCDHDAFVRTQDFASTPDQVRGQWQECPKTTECSQQDPEWKYTDLSVDNTGCNALRVKGSMYYEAANGDYGLKATDPEFDGCNGRPVFWKSFQDLYLYYMTENTRWMIGNNPCDDGEIMRVAQDVYSPDNINETWVELDPDTNDWMQSTSLEVSCIEEPTTTTTTTTANPAPGRASSLQKFSWLLIAALAVGQSILLR